MSKTLELVRLSRELGREDRQFTILGEGNTSVDLGNGTFLVKSSGSSLATMEEADLSLVSHGKIDEMLARESITEQEIEDGLVSSLVDPSHKKPSMEAFLHSLCLRQPGVNWVGHTHTVSVVSILASKYGAEPFRKHVFPDAVVVCGKEVVSVAYLDPGLELAKAVGQRLSDYLTRHGKPPKVILMENHGPVALGASSREVLNIMLMLDKWARVLLGTLSIGGPAYMADDDAEKIDRRLDEAYRRKQLGG